MAGSLLVGCEEGRWWQLGAPIHPPTSPPTSPPTCEDGCYRGAVLFEDRVCILVKERRQDALQRVVHHQQAGDLRGRMGGRGKDSKHRGSAGRGGKRRRRLRRGGTATHAGCCRRGSVIRCPFPCASCPCTHSSEARQHGCGAHAAGGHHEEQAQEVEAHAVKVQEEVLRAPGRAAQGRDRSRRGGGKTAQPYGPGVWN